MNHASNPASNPAPEPAPELALTPAGILRAAAAYLAEHGWVQGGYYESNVSVPTPAACSVGAIARVIYGRVVEPLWSPDLCDLDDSRWDDLWATLSVLHRYLLVCGAMEASSNELADVVLIGAWNDLDDQTAGSVITTMVGAAEQWDRTNGGAA